MNSYPFDCIIEVNTEYEEITVVKESVKEPIKGWDSVLDFEISQTGIDYLFDLSSNPLPDGRWRIKGSIWYDQDYFGEWDGGADIDSIQPANRRARRELTRARINENTKLARRSFDERKK